MDTLRILFITLMSFLYGVSLFGWGHLASRRMYIHLPWPFLIATGIAIWIIIGGLLNMLNIAFAFSLDALVVTGLLYWIWLIPYADKKDSFVKMISSWPGHYWTGLAGGLVVFIIFIFTAATQVPPQVFNFHDDLEKYFAYPVRMLATGTLHGGSFNALGSNTIGGQSFLHGFILSHWNIQYINTVDSLFALALCQLVILAFALKMCLPAWLTLLSVIVPVFISPQYVNVSSLYTSSIFVMMLILSPYIVEIRGSDKNMDVPTGVLTGMIYTSLVVLKPTLIIMVVAHFIISVILLLCLRQRRTAMSYVGGCTVTVGITMLPWVLVHRMHVKNLLEGVGIINDSSLINTIKANEFVYAMLPPEFHLFSLKPLLYGHGSTMMHYTTSIIAVGLCVLLSSYLFWKAGFLGQLPYALSGAGGLAVIASFFTVMYITAGQVSGSRHGLRYMCPIIIAALPSVFLIAAHALVRKDRRGLVPLWLSRCLIALLALILIGLMAFFSGSLIARTRQALHYGSSLSFKSTDANYRAYNKLVMDDRYKERMRGIQERVPRGEALLAWTGTPYLLDFRRNTILDVQPAAFAAPWFNFPLGRSVESAYAYFEEKGIRYILWEYNGFATRSIREWIDKASSPYPGTRRVGIRSLAFVYMLSAIVKESEILFDDDQMVLIKIRDSQFKIRDSQ